MRFNPYLEHFEQVLIAAQEVLEIKDSYLEALEYCNIEDQKYKNLESEGEEVKDVIAENSILNAELANVQLDQQELDLLNKCIDVGKRIILTVSDSKYVKLK